MKPTLLALLLTLVVVPSASSLPRQQTLRADVDLVSVYFNVRDSKDRLVTNLGKESFKVFEDGREQPVSFFAQHADLPLTVGILLDTSTSLPRTLALEAEAAGHFFKRVMQPNGDLGFLVAYASRIDTLQLPTEQVSVLADKAQSIRRYAKMDDVGATPVTRTPPPQTQTIGGFPMPVQIPARGPNPASLRVARLYDAIGSSVERFLSRETGRKALVIVALADDAGSEASLKSALRTLKQDDVIAYVLQVQHAPTRDRDDCDISHIFREGPEQRIARFAEETGGRVIRVEGFERMQEAFDRIADELHRQYSVGYQPLNRDWNGAFRKLVIDAGRGYKVNARDGYYATRRN